MNKIKLIIALALALLIAPAYAQQNIGLIPTDSLLGRDSPGTGQIEVITLGANLSLNGSGVLSATGGGGGITSSGTPVDNQIAIWTSATNLEGDTGFTFNTTNDDLIIAASGNLLFGAVTILDDNAGTMTLDNIDTLGATTETTVEAAIDTLANLTSIQARTVTLADAGANAIFGWDDGASAYENLTKAEAQTILGLQTSTTDNQIVRYDSTAGNQQGSALVIADTTGSISGATSGFSIEFFGATGTDTTLTSPSAGNLNIEGNAIWRTGGSALASMANLGTLLSDEAAGWITFGTTPSMANLGTLLTDDASGWITFGTTPTSANLRSLLTDEIGTGVLVFLGTPADDQVSVGDSASAVTWRTIPDSDAATQKLQYDQATNTFSAGTDDDVPDSGDYTNLTGGTGITNTAGTLSVDGTELATVTWGAGATLTWTFDAGTNDTVLTVASSSITWAVTAATFNLDDEMELRFFEEDAGGANYIGFKAPAAVTANVTCTFENDSNPIPDSCVGNGVDDGGAGSVSISGTPADNQVAVWTSTTAIEGDTAFTFDTTTDALSIGTSGVFNAGTIELGAATDTTIARSGAGTLTVESVGIVRGATGGTDNSILRADGTGGTLLQNSVLVIADTTGSISGAASGFSIEFFGASGTDTTLTSPSAGNLNIEGNAIYRAGGTDVAVADGGTGASTLTDLITLTTMTSGVYVAQVADGTGIDGTANAEGATYTPTLDLTEISTATFGAGAFTTLIFDAGATDPTFTFASNSTTVSNSATFSLGTSAAFTTGTIELGAATDTTIARTGAGAISVEGSAVQLASTVDVVQVADGTGIDGTCSTASCTYTPTLDLTEQNTQTFGSGTFTTATFDAGAVDPVLTFGSGTLLIEAVVSFRQADAANAGGSIKLLEDPGTGSNFIAFLAPASITSDVTCTLENDSNPIPDSCVGDGTDGGGAGSQTPWTSNIDADGFNLLFDDATGIKSAEAGNPSLLLFTSAASAVNYFTIQNSATGVDLGFLATGSDTDIDIDITPKGAGVVQVTGTNKLITTINTNDEAFAESITMLAPNLTASNRICNILGRNSASGNWNNLCFLYNGNDDNTNAFDIAFNSKPSRFRVFNGGGIAIGELTSPGDGNIALGSTGTIEFDNSTATSLTDAGAGELTIEGKRIKHAGRQTVSLLAASGISSGTATPTGCTPVGNVDSGSNDIITRQCQFSAGTDNSMYWTIVPPKGTDESVDLAARVDWTSTTGTDATDNVIWTMACVAFSNDDSMNGNAFPSPDTVTDTQTAAGDFLSSGEITGITPAGTWTEGDALVCRVTRDADAAGDNFNGTADLINVQLYFTDSGSTDD